MTENNQPVKRNDFISRSFIEKSQHNRDMNGIKKRLDDLEKIAGDKERFISTFVESYESSTKMHDIVLKSVDEHDNHQIKITFMSVGKTLLVGAVSAFITWLVVQALLIPQYNLKIDTLQNEVNELKQQS